MSKEASSTSRLVQSSQKGESSRHHSHHSLNQQQPARQNHEDFQRFQNVRQEHIHTPECSHVHEKQHLMAGPTPLPHKQRQGWSQEFNNFQNIQMPQKDMQEMEHIYTRGAVQARWDTSKFASDQHWNQEFNQDRQFQMKAQMMQTSQLDKSTSSRDPSQQDWVKQFESVKLSSQLPHVHATWNQEFTNDQATHESWEEEFKQQSRLLSSSEPQPIINEKDGEVNWQEQFEEMWQGMKENQTKIGRDGDWANEFRDLGAADEDYLEQYTGSGVNGMTGALDGEYIFETENPYIGRNDAFQEGSLTQAALAFEAAVQQQPQDDLAWQHLGMVQAENEKEVPAILALERGVKENPANALAVSYTNEGHISQALSSLDRWLTISHPYLAMTPLQDSQSEHERLTSYFLLAIQNSNLDAELQIGLGLLFYNTSEFEKTIDCFTAALSLRPTDYLLWSRLGATLSNSGNNEGAIEAYYKALELKPTFVRGRYNLGVSCMNIGCFQEAAEHFLGALNSHDPNTIHESKTLWDTLYRNFILMERRDLADLALGRDVNTFKPEFKF